MYNIKRLSHSIFRSFGYDFMRYIPENFISLRRMRILKTQNINLLLDVGASESTYSLQLRQHGYEGNILSFEPLSESFAVLQQRAARDPLWSCENLALGDSDGMIEINVSGHKTSSSILPISETHLNAMPSSAFIDLEKVRVARLDSLKSIMIKRDAVIYLKVDVQGYEKQVLEGARETLKQTRVIELELSLAPMYVGGADFMEMITYLTQLEFKMVSIEPVFTDPKTGQILQVDGIFVKEEVILDV